MMDLGRDYAELVRGYGRISRGVFRPEHAEEHWEGTDGPVRIVFDVEGAHYEIEADGSSDWVDPEVLRRLEAFLEGSPYTYEHLVTGDQTAFVVALTSEEKARLERERPQLFDGESAY